MDDFSYKWISIHILPTCASIIREFGMTKIVARSKLIGNVRTIVDNSRTHSIVCDLPKTKDGQDTGPTALELAVMSLADCAVTIFAKVAKNSKIELKDVEVIAEAERPADSTLVSHVRLKVNITANAGKSLIEACWRRTEANCPVVAIFKKPIHVDVEVNTVKSI
jgi:uncharacterized OsmC-like protein